MKTMAGNVLTKELLKYVDKAAYQYGGLDCFGKHELIIVDNKPFFTKIAVYLPVEFIKIDKAAFISKFNKTMNSSIYNLIILDIDNN